MPVNIVFLGYQPEKVDVAAFMGALPKTHQPKVMTRLMAGIDEKIGITYSYDYKVRFADRKYQDRFFGQLAKLAKPAPVTSFQADYNAQQKNNRDVTANHHIDAPSVEKWLAKNPPAGVDTRRNTVFLINWHDRADFKFHVYTKTDEPDPDTGYNFGTERASRKIVAWGGTTAKDEESGLGSTHRIWFHDLSAGPDAASGSWNVDDADLDGDNVPDYRIPPAWEYAAGGYRPPSALTGDLAKLIRYVALQLLFTSSPLYPADLPVDGPAKSINLDSNTYEGWPGTDANSKYIKPPLVKAELGEVLKQTKLTYDDQDLAFDGEAKRCYDAFLNNVSCYPEEGLEPFANFYLQNKRELSRVLDDQGKVDYELPIFNYAVGPGVDVPALGFADSNYVDGTQSFVFNFASPDVVESGYGLSTTIIHEVGHHIGLAHPHDGYDGTTGELFDPSGPTYFAWLGDQSNTMMSYIDLNWDFSQFDHDNLDRFRTAAQNQAANDLAAEALAAPGAIRAYDDLARADVYLGLASSSLRNHQYDAARTWAAKAYDAVAKGARDAGVDVAKAEAEAQAESRATRAKTPAHPNGLYVDTEHGPRSQP
ncbi:hypothetical protein ACWCOV_19505 [Kribbella sp. NPDC002412]